LQNYLEDARTQGARIIEINPEQEQLEDVRKIAPTLLTGVTTEMDIMKNEIFGPILPIFEYDHIEDVIEFINLRPRPLALYYFDFDQARADYVAERTHSGILVKNRDLVAQDDLPFGGIGASGMGKYHGKEGFSILS
jgi:coniferyl-aldehyde dehydrogenase